MEKKLMRLGAMLFAWALLAGALSVEVLAANLGFANDGQAMEAYTDKGFFDERVNQGYSLKDWFSGNEPRASFSSGGGEVRMASCFPQTAAVNSFYGGQLNNPERYLYRQLASFYASATAQRGVNGQIEFEIGSGYPFENLTEAQFGALYDACSNEMLVYWGTAIQAFMQDNPQYDVDDIYYYGACYLVCHDEETDLYTGEITARIKFDYIGSTANIYDRHAALQKALSGVKCEGSRFEKVRALHDYVCDRVEYSYAGDSPYNAYGALVQRKAVCQGYALAFKALCDRENIPCQAIGGRAGGGSHMWNAVQMENGGWYAVDTTWDDQADRIHYDFCLIGSGSAPVDFTRVTFGQSHTVSMQCSYGSYSDSLKALQLSSACYSGVPFNDKLQVEIKPAFSVYNGYERRPSVTVRHQNSVLEEYVDYTVAYQNNVDAGTASIVLTGKGSYTGSLTRSFAIRKSLRDCQISIKPENGILEEGKKPTINIKDGNKTLEEGKDYTVTYEDGDKEGEKIVRAKGDGDYTEDVTKVFKVRKSLAKCEVIIQDEDRIVYTGKAQKPKITVKSEDKTLKQGTDYKIKKWQKNTNAGKASVTLAGMGQYTGEVTKTFRIQKADPKLVYTKSFSKIYGDSPFMLNAKLKAGDGKLTYASSDFNIVEVRKNGRAFIKGAGIVTITLKAPETRNCKPANGQVTVRIAPRKQIITLLKSENGKKLSMKWRPDASASGYVVQCASDVAFNKTIGMYDIRSNRITSKSIQKLKKGRWYYVRVFSYKTVKKKTPMNIMTYLKKLKKLKKGQKMEEYYLIGQWSKPQKVKIK